MDRTSIQSAWRVEEVRGFSTLGARLSALSGAFVSDRAAVFAARSRLRDEAEFGPAHVIFPQGMERNVRDMQSVLRSHDVCHRILFAHKPTKSPAFVREAHALGLGIDVASAEELRSALDAGFRRTEIECTGAKAERFLELAIAHGCLLSVDSIPELERIIALRKRMDASETTELLLRVTDLDIPGRKFVGRPSRFGIRQCDLPHAYAVLANHPELHLQGFHVHSDKRTGADRAAQLEALIEILRGAYHLGFTPTVLNIGGGFRRAQFDAPGTWESFIGGLEERLVGGESLPTWGAFTYGLRLNDAGKIVARGKAMAVGEWTDFADVLEEMLTSRSMTGERVIDFLRDNEITLMLEPGYALLENCGMSLFDVIETKVGGGGHEFIVLDGNFMNVAAQYRDVVVDPIHIPRYPNDGGEPCEAFLVGTVCREEDLFMRRKVSFRSRPLPSDCVCFPNTAAYRMDFEDSSPHQHPRGKRIVAVSTESGWHFQAEQQYRPSHHLGEHIQ
ncbi:MAG: hypothetical protein IT290_01125 [Deltaproteobacteria bacterium]|nr:hypothetical protein [Deltaproteobacteria bacterium]